MCGAVRLFCLVAALEEGHLSWETSEAVLQESLSCSSAQPDPPNFLLALPFKHPHQIHEVE